MDTLKVMTLNVGSLFEPDWEIRSLEIVAWLNKVKPDVVCLQEVYQKPQSEHAATSVAQLTETDWYVAFGGAPIDVAEADPDSRFGSAVLSRWPIDSFTYHHLPSSTDNTNSRAAKIPWELIYARTAGLDVFSTHLVPAPNQGSHRQKQVLAIDKIINQTCPADEDIELDCRPIGMPPILCGDFNAEPDSDEIRFLRGFTTLDNRSTFYQDAWAIAGGDGPGFTQDWRNNPMAADLNIHQKRIDYIFVGDPFRRAGSAGRVLSSTIVCDKPLIALHPSDHWGVLTEVAWPNRPAPPIGR